ncbi:uncharacterized protein (TIGR04141 family) [Kribbella orskensis]|uniref:Uncharacterized protein (TIGR04141 family) n=1 Tax=Kribbella orskensis TaxID=2512216 RepID=A0ABY2B7F3_9ACTN|nr:MULTISPECIES: DUF6119 family protein [Kribbella]TCN30067.1 uncharacterized protein (TIGR04141 family) [Kribbella sp. VKM Ac-2500]TCO10249.1 uncharacterized protein (TIGR04141 family) [Kribbella orskensis]
MARKTHSFSIYLLKKTYDASNALTAGHKLEESHPGKPTAGVQKVFILKGTAKPPWWKEYFKLNDKLLQEFQGSLVFIEVAGRNFAVSFGSSYNYLREESYEYDFGLRVTLNCIDPDKIKNTDAVSADSARRQRTQMPSDSDLTFFDVDSDSTILKALAGKVRAEHKGKIGSATGSNSLRITSPVDPDSLKDLLGELVGLYESDAYRTRFPSIRNIQPIKDPPLVGELNLALVEAIRSRSANVSMAVPDIVDYRDELFADFTGEGTSQRYDSISIDAYYDYLDDNSFDFSTLTYETLQRHRARLINGENEPRQGFSAHRCFVYEATLKGDTAVYHCVDGSWYRVDRQFLEELTSYLDAKITTLDLRDCAEHLEGDYNKETAKTPGIICLDTKDISPSGATNVEPCDLLTLRDERALLIHVKIGTSARELSHLFNQGANSAELLKSEARSRTKLQQLIKSQSKPNDPVIECQEAVAQRRYSVMYAIITNKEASEKSKNLPLFSKISLRRSLRTLDNMEVPVFCGFVKDGVDRSGKEKVRRPRKARKKPE